MKWIFRLMTLAMLGVALGLPFFIDNQQGQPMLALPSLSGLPDISLPEPASIRTVYKWQDAAGVWHYGDTVPEEGTYAANSYRSLEVNDQTNVVQFLTEEERASLAPPAVTEPQPIAGVPATPKPPEPAAEEGGLTLERALNVINDAKAARDQMNARNQQLQQIMGDHQ